MGVRAVSDVELGPYFFLVPKTNWQELTCGPPIAGRPKTNWRELTCGPPIAGPHAEPSFVRPLVVVGQLPPGTGSRAILDGCNDATLLGPILPLTRVSMRFFGGGFSHCNTMLLIKMVMFYFM